MKKSICGAFSIGEIIQSRLPAYMVAAGAVISVTSSEAAIRTITLDNLGKGNSLTLEEDITDGGSVTIDAGPFSTEIFGVHQKIDQQTFIDLVGLGTTGSELIGNMQFLGSNYIASKLVFGDALPGSLPANGVNFFNKSNGFSGGNFMPEVNGSTMDGYVGFQHTNGSYVGWLKVSISTWESTGQSKTFSIVANSDGVYGAYGLLSDGLTVGQVSSIPEPATMASGLGLLALGAAGLREHRRRRTRAEVESN
jgi:PEP-CTERM motif